MRSNTNKYNSKIQLKKLNKKIPVRICAETQGHVPGDRSSFCKVWDANHRSEKINFTYHYVVWYTSYRSETKLYSR